MVPKSSVAHYREPSFRKSRDHRDFALRFSGFQRPQERKRSGLTKSNSVKIMSMLFRRTASGCGGAGDSCDVFWGVPGLHKRFQAVVQCCKGSLTVHAWGWYSSDSKRSRRFPKSWLPNPLFSCTGPSLSLRCRGCVEPGSLVSQ